MKVNITCRYGEKDYLHPNGHTGIDFSFQEGTPLHAIKSGVAHLVDYGNKNIGKGVIIEHSDGSKDIYGHLSEFHVKEGQRVFAGDEIALTGNTGRSTGEHLHFGQKDSAGHFIDPSSHIDAILNQAHHTHWYDFIIVTKGLFYDLAVDPKGWIYEKAGELVQGGLLDIVQDCVSALPICAVMGGCVYFFVSMFSKKLAKVSFISTIIYGLFIARGL